MVIVANQAVRSLAATIGETEEFRKQLHSWPPATSDQGKGLVGVMEDELGFVD